MEGEEWNTVALGATKEKLADSLIRRLCTQFAPGGLLHHGQGKWYPGEPLPRWAYSCCFRVDGEPIWQDLNRISYGQVGNANVEQASQLIEALAMRLGVGKSQVVPAYEDVLYYLWRERRLPVNVDPFDFTSRRRA